jgi:S1-C subfamily serine protease
VEPGTPAWRSEIQEGDIVTAIDGAAIEADEELMLRIGRLPVEARVKLDLLRGEQKLTKTVVLAKYLVHGRQLYEPEPAWRGLRVDYSTVRKPGPFGHPFGPDLYDGCVLVSEVESDSPAWESGLRPGMFITHVEGQRVKTPKDFRTAVSNKRQTLKIRLGGVRSGEDAVREVKAGSG